MRILFVRHGDPDYRANCLTELGHQQAKAASLRLESENICEIYSSPYGRARETAMYTAERIEKDIMILDCMKEVSWGSSDGNELYENGHPWKTAEYAVSLGYSLMDERWTKKAHFSNNILFLYVEQIAYEADKWLETLGYRREGDYYRVIGDDTDKTIALFSHGGSSSAFLSRLLNLPFFYLCKTLCPAFTAITSISLSNEKGTLTAPKIEYANDAKHIKSESVSYQM